MKSIESMRSDRKKLSMSIEKLQERVRELDKNIEMASMREIWEESMRHGITSAEELRKVVLEVKKQNSMILGNGGKHDEI